MDGLWDLHIPTYNHRTLQLPPSVESHQINAIILKNQTKTELATYLHASAGFPAVSTFVQAIKNGNFITWPGIDQLSFPKHLKNLSQRRKDILTKKEKIFRAPQNQFNLKQKITKTILSLSLKAPMSKRLKELLCSLILVPNIQHMET